MSINFKLHKSSLCYQDLENKFHQLLPLGLWKRHNLKHCVRLSVSFFFFKCTEFDFISGFGFKKVRVVLQNSLLNL